MSGRAGRIRLPDIALVLFCTWCTLSFVLVNGLEPSIQSIGILWIETLGPYLLARCYIRNAAAFTSAIHVLYCIVLVLSPFAIVEVITGQNILLDLFSVLWTSVPSATDIRGGLKRGQSVFDHPILFGVFTGSILALVHSVLGYDAGVGQKVSKTGVVGLTAGLSLSAGPIIAVATQCALLVWNWLFRRVRYRWWLLIGLTIFAFLSIEVAANRSALGVVTSYVVFDPESYWFRRVIWTYGVESVQTYPVWGVGNHEWPRPSWMPGSIDNFYLFLAVRHGLPAAFLMMSALFFVVMPLSLKGGLSDRLEAYRTGFLVSIVAFFLVGWTVAFWASAYVLFFFLLGSGTWMLGDKVGVRIQIVRLDQPRARRDRSQLLRPLRHHLDDSAAKWERSV
jgi:hypothetical protein